MVAIFDSPDFLISKNHLKKFGFFKKIFYLILGFILGLIHKHFKGTLFTVLINFFLRKKVKLKYEKPFYVWRQPKNSKTYKRIWRSCLSKLLLI